MKTVIKKIKFGVLLAGFVVLVSCGNNLSTVSLEGIKVMNRNLPLLAVQGSKYAGNKIAEYIKSSPTPKKTKTTEVKKTKKASRSKKGLPISIGMAAEAQLVSSQPSVQ